MVEKLLPFRVKYLENILRKIFEKKLLGSSPLKNF